MKKMMTIALSLALAASVLSGCGKTEAPETTAAPTTEAVTEAPTEVTTEPAAEETTEAATEETAAPITGPSADALAIYETIWDDYAEDEKFPIGGGNSEAFIMNAPGAYDMAGDTSSLTYTLLVPQEYIDQMDGAATMLHLMNTNTFASGLFHMVEGTDMTAFADTMKEIIKNNPFVCGFPETMLIAVVEGEYMLVSFGNGEIMANFQAHLEAVYPETEILHTDSIM